MKIELSSNQLGMSVLVRPNQTRGAAGISIHLYTNRQISLKFRIKSAACSPCKSHLSGTYLATLCLQMTKLASKLLHFKDVGNSSELKYIMIPVSLGFELFRWFFLSK